MYGIINFISSRIRDILYFLREYEDNVESVDERNRCYEEIDRNKEMIETCLRMFDRFNCTLSFDIGKQGDWRKDVSLSGVFYEFHGERAEQHHFTLNLESTFSGIFVDLLPQDREKWEKINEKYGLTHSIRNAMENWLEITVDTDGEKVWWCSGPDPDETENSPVVGERR